MSLLTEEEIEIRLEEIRKVRIALDSDPASLGLNSLNQKLSEVQLYKDRVQYLLSEAMRNHAESEIVKEQAQFAYDRKMDTLLATDPTVQAQKSEAMRSAHARTQMSEEVLKLHQAEVSEITANWYLKTLQTIINNLESANSNLSRQITVLQMSATLGEMPRGVIKSLTV